MNQGNNQNNVQMNNQNINNTSMPNTSTPIQNTKISNVNLQNTQPMQQQVNTNPNLQTQMPINNQVNVVEPTVVKPTQNVIVTNKKSSSNIVIFIIIIAIGVFIYYLNDVLAYFNQNFSPVVENETKENGSENLVGGYIKIDTTNSYIKLKGIRFYNVKKLNSKNISISYVSDKNYTSSVPLNILIQVFNSNKEKIYEEIFNVSGSIESNVVRQYKLSLEENIYNNAVYLLVKVGE